MGKWQFELKRPENTGGHYYVPKMNIEKLYILIYGTFKGSDILPREEQTNHHVDTIIAQKGSVSCHSEV
jgi:hypothetical protein